MTDFMITFARPWLLLLLIPAVALTLITYFLLPKRYRKTRNRIVSMVLHTIVMVLCISVLAGIKFEYNVPNVENEIILLVDVSDTSEESKATREEFMQTVINESQYDNFKVGVVTFGFTQVYAVPLTYETDTIFQKYLEAPLPDTTATDIAAALRYASTLVSYPESAKIVLISDGKETDETATNVVRSISARGIRIDTVYINSGFSDDNVQVVGVEFPNYHVNVNDNCPINVLVNAKKTSHAIIEIFDNGEYNAETDQMEQDVPMGTQSITFNKKFTEEGLHEIRVKVTESGDKVGENNTYYSYIYLEMYNRVLVIDRGVVEKESDALSDLLSKTIAGEENDIEYNVTPLHLNDAESLPASVEELLDYDQIILNNISNADLEASGLVDMIYSYVNDYGGGLFTTGGSKTGDDGNPVYDDNGFPVANAYNRFDLLNTKLQQMLPVQAIDYTPPVGVVIVIDVSGSMSDKIEWAKNGASTCLEALTMRDYVGVITLASDYHTELQLTCRSEETAIKRAINSISSNGSTEYAPAIIRAAQALIAEKRVDRRHIVLVSDGYPTDKDANDYLIPTETYYRNNNITLSVIGVNMYDGDEASKTMKTLAAAGHGRVFYPQSEGDLLTSLMGDLNAPEIKQQEAKEFHPAVQNRLSPVVEGLEVSLVQDTNDAGEVIKETANALPFQLGGVYGVRARDRADTILVGDYEVPIYAQWKFGAGMVGSFMCDLSGVWSEELFKDTNGQKLVKNIVANLMPTENIRPRSIRFDLEEENYINRLSIYATLEEGERIEAGIIEYDDSGENVISFNKLTGDADEADVYVTGDLNADNHYTRSTFVVKKSGTYKIFINKIAADGTVAASVETYKTFSYSKEYERDPEITEFDPSAYMQELSRKGNGNSVSAEDPWSIFNDFVTGNHRVYDPALVFMIIAAVCFLLDVAVRKFKFKWPHEIIRNIKERRAAEKE